MKKLTFGLAALGVLCLWGSARAQQNSAAASAESAWWKPYSPPCVERENVFVFTEKPAENFVLALREGGRERLMGTGPMTTRRR